jgi:acyl CoA:acetate/3-ketoacid CoA transferase alpha subunit
MYRNRLFLKKQYCNRDAPDDIIKAMIDIGGKELVIKKDNVTGTALHSACLHGKSYDIIKMLIEVGGNDLVTAKDDCGNNAFVLAIVVYEWTRQARRENQTHFSSQRT